MNKIITTTIQDLEAKVPTLQNQHDRTSFIAVLPIQANANYTKPDKDNLETYWAQLLVNFSSDYQRTDELGQVTDDNKSLKTLVISFPKAFLDKNQVSISEFTSFFEAHYIAKKFLFIPVSEEKQSFQYQNGKSIPIKNQTKVTIDSNFDFRAFISSHKK